MMCTIINVPLYGLYITLASISISNLSLGRLRRLLRDGDALQGAVVPLGALSILGCSSLLFDAAAVSAWRWQGLVVLELGGDVHVVAVCKFLKHVFHGELARVGAIGLVHVVGESNWCDGIREIILLLIGGECLVVLLEDWLYRFAAFFACTAGWAFLNVSFELLGGSFLNLLVICIICIDD